MPAVDALLAKEAISKGRLTVAQSRKGRRPLSVSTFLRKEKEGTLYKAALEKKLGTLGGVLAGTEVGLDGGTALGRALDKRRSASSKLAEKIALEYIVDHPDYASRSEGAVSEKPRKAKRSKSSPAAQLFPPYSNDPREGFTDYSPFVPTSTRSGDAPTRKATGNALVTASRGMIYSPKVASPHILTVSELDKVCALYLESVRGFSSDKLASTDLEELHKEAIIGALQRVVPGASKVIRMGDEVIDMTPKSNFSYKGMGKKLEQLGGAFKLPQNVSPAMARTAGNTRAGSISGRVFGEGLQSAGHHMGHASAVGKTLNPIGKPLGGFIEGVTKGTGQELQRSAGTLGRAAGGGARGSLGRGMVRHAGKVGLGGEILGAAGTATALGHAVSPAAHGLALAAKKTGLYAPLQQHLGSLGFNTAKDVAATGVEKVLGNAPRVAQGLRGLGAAAGRVLPSIGKAAL